MKIVFIEREYRMIEDSFLVRKLRIVIMSISDFDKKVLIKLLQVHFRSKTEKVQDMAN